MVASNIVVAGIGRFGSQAASNLFQLGHDVLAVDPDQDRVQDIIGRVTYSVAGDATDEHLMRDLGVHNFDIAVVGIGRNVEASIMTAALLNSFEIPVIIARARNPLHAQTLSRIGCHRIITPEEDAGERLANSLFNPNVSEYISLGATFGVSKLPIPERFNNMTLREAGFTDARDRYRLSVMALLRSETTRLVPGLDERLRPEDHVVVAGDKGLIDNLI